MKRILIVDDSKMARLITKTCIPKDMGFIVDEASGCEEALERAGENIPDVVLCDYNMPVKNGVEVAEEFQKLGLGSKFVLVSANIQKEVIKAAMKTDFVSFLKKPINKESLAKCIEEALR